MVVLVQYSTRVYLSKTEQRQSNNVEEDNWRVYLVMKFSSLDTLLLRIVKEELRNAINTRFIGLFSIWIII